MTATWVWLSMMARKASSWPSGEMRGWEAMIEPPRTVPDQEGGRADRARNQTAADVRTSRRAQLSAAGGALRESRGKDSGLGAAAGSAVGVPLATLGEVLPPRQRSGSRWWARSRC